MNGPIDSIILQSIFSTFTKLKRINFTEVNKPFFPIFLTKYAPLYHSLLQTYPLRLFRGLLCHLLTFQEINIFHEVAPYASFVLSSRWRKRKPFSSIDRKLHTNVFVACNFEGKTDWDGEWKVQFVVFLNSLGWCSRARTRRNVSLISKSD